MARGHTGTMARAGALAAVALVALSSACGARTNLLLLGDDDGGAPGPGPGPSCAATLCAGACVDLTNDAANCGACGKNCQGGACTASVCQAVTLVNGGNFEQLALDTALLYTATLDGIYTLPLGGGTPTQIGGRANVNYLTLDGANVFWSWAHSPNAGTGVLAFSKTGGPERAVMRLDNPFEIAVDAQHVYATSPNAVSFVSRAGTPATQVIAGGQVYPLGIAVDATDLYWCELGDLAAAQGGNVWKWNVAGPTPAPVIALAAGQNQPGQIALDDTHVYFTAAGTPGSGFHDGAVLRMRKDGSAPPKEIATGQFFPFAIAVDADNVYWTTVAQTDRTHATENAHGTVMRAPKRGGTAVVIAKEQTQPVRVALDGTSVYWANAGTYGVNGEPHNDGSIVKIAK